MSREENDPIRKGRPTEGRFFSPYLSAEADIWFERLELAADEDELLQTNAWPRFAYIGAVVVAVMGAIQRGRVISPDQPFESVIEFLDQDYSEEDWVSNNWVLPSCTIIADEWLKDHPDSKSARIVKDQGLAAPLGVHTQFLIEIYNKFLEQEGLPRNPPFTVIIMPAHRLTRE